MNRNKQLLAFTIASVALLPGFRTTQLMASGPIGIYGIVEKAVFEPNEASPERLQLWGAFAYVEGSPGQGLAVSVARRGYLYFKMPSVIPGFADQRQLEIVKKEWADLKTVAGTGQAIGFGSWASIGIFDRLQPDVRSSEPPYILERSPQGNTQADLRVRPASEAPSSPTVYQTNAGIVKLSDSGSHAAIVKQLQEALKRGR